MIRIFLISICIFSLTEVNLSSGAIIESTIYPIVAFTYILFNIFELLVFLHANGINLMKEIVPDSGEAFSSIIDVITVILDDRTEKYHGNFNFLGSFSSVAEEISGYVELGCATYSFFLVFMLIGQAVST